MYSFDFLLPPIPFKGVSVSIVRHLGLKTEVSGTTNGGTSRRRGISIFSEVLKIHTKCPDLYTKVRLLAPDPVY